MSRNFFLRLPKSQAEAKICGKSIKLLKKSIHIGVKNDTLK